MKALVASSLLLYVLTVTWASGQVVDQSTIIDNQVDQNVYQTLTEPTTYSNPPTIHLGKFSFTQDNGSFSGFQTDPKLLQKSVLFYQTFNTKDSFVGMGVTDTYTALLGLDFRFKSGTDIQPFLSYGYASREFIGTNTYRSSGLGGQLNITQKIFPVFALTRGQGAAVDSFGATPPDGEPGKTLADGKGNILPGRFWKDVYPNCDLVAGLTMGLSAPGVAMESKGVWKHTSQDNYSISPALTYDLFLRPPVSTDEDGNVISDAWESLIPNSISFINTYSFLSNEVNNGTNGSSGVLSVQERNTYIIPVGVGTLPMDPILTTTPTDLVPRTKGTIQIIQSNTILHDTNQEPLTPPTSAIPYQNWAKFGLSIGYNTKDYNVKIEYTYEAFNALYDSQNINASLSVAF